MTFSEIVDYMLRCKIQKCSVDGISVELHPSAFEKPPGEPEAAEFSNEIGKTGMTKQEQVDLFGQVFEADFRQER